MTKKKANQVRSRIRTVNIVPVAAEKGRNKVLLGSPGQDIAELQRNTKIAQSIAHANKWSIAYFT